MSIDYRWFERGAVRVAVFAMPAARSERETMFAGRVLRLRSAIERYFIRRAGPVVKPKVVRYRLTCRM